MSWSSSLRNGATSPKRDKTKFKGVRRRKWGKWVSEIRVPGTQERLWLGTYATAEAAAVAHDVAVYCLRRPSSLDKLNFPETLSSYNVQVPDLMSPRSVQKVASDVGMDVDARNIVAAKTTSSSSSSLVVAEEETYVSTTKKNDDDVCVVGTIADTSDMFSLYHGFGSDACWKTWPASAQDCIQNEPLSISIEDYL